MRLTLTEYAKFGSRWPTESGELAELRAESLRWKTALGLRETPFALVRGRGGRGGQIGIKARGVTGFLSIGAVRIEVAPKFLRPETGQNWHAALWRILALVEESPTLAPPVTAGITGEESLPDLLGWILLDGLRRAQMSGFPRGYSEHEGALPTLRGRLDTARLGDLLVQPHLLPCIYDVYDEDVPLNRLLRWAATALAGAVQSPRLSRALEDEAAGFLGVSSHPPGLIEAENLVLPLQHAHLQGALGVARLLLRRQTLQHGDEDHAAPGYLWNSADVFEKFVRYLLHEVCARRGWRLEKPPQILARGISPGAKRITTIPDFLIYRGGKVILALDAKYKVGDPRSDDVYQIMAAGRINACPHVCLVYPAPSSLSPARSWRISGLGNPQKLTSLYVDPIQMATKEGEQALLQQLTNDLALVLNLSDST